MELTGKCKEAFEKWLRDLHLDSDKRRIDTDRTIDDGITYAPYYYENFVNLPESMQYGVYVDFFEANNIFIWVEHNEIARLWHYWISTKPMSNDINCQSIYTLHEARTAAIEKANELFNERS